MSNTTKDFNITKEFIMSRKIIIQDRKFLEWPFNYPNKKSKKELSDLLPTLALISISREYIPKNTSPIRKNNEFSNNRSLIQEIRSFSNKTPNWSRKSSLLQWKRNYWKISGIRKKDEDVNLRSLKMRKRTVSAPNIQMNWLLKKQSSVKHLITNE